MDELPPYLNKERLQQTAFDGDISKGYALDSRYEIL